jgi:hypothetical protein
MSHRAPSWIDPARWVRLLERPRVGTVEGSSPGASSGGRSGGIREVERATGSPGPDPGRLDGLLEQARGVSGVEGAFVCDAAGRTLAAGRMETLELSLAPSLMGLFAHQRRTSGGPERGMLMLAFGGRRRLHLMETSGPDGCYALGLVADRTLPDAVLLRLQLELARLVRASSPAAT